MLFNESFLYLDLTEAANALTPKMLLNKDELILLHRRTSGQQQANFMAGRYALKRLLIAHTGGTWLDWQILPKASGQPRAFFKHHAVPINLSISHSRSKVACVISTNEYVGIDIEDKKPRDNLAELVAQIASDEEQAWWQMQEDQLSAFYDLWTTKEAVGKLYGAGIIIKQAVAESISTYHPIDDTTSICTIAALPIKSY